MASFGKQVFFFFFLVIFSSIQARESTFFSKFTHYSITKNNGRKESTISSVPIQAPTLAPAPAIDFLPDVPLLAPAPAPVLGEIEEGYDLFGEGSGTSPRKETSTTTTTTTAVDENELLNEELDGVPFDQKYENSNYNNNGYKVGSARYETGNLNNNGYKVGSARYESGNQNNNGYTNNYYNSGYKLASESYETENKNSENGYTNNYNNNGNTNNNYNNNGYTTNYNNNGYETERQGMSDTRFMEGGKYYYHVKNTERQGMSDTRFMDGGKYYNNVKNTERQGMSDTRFMEGGKYYSNVKNENYYPANEYVSGKVSTQNQGSYGNDENPHEFNTMEEYESQEGYEESQEESLP
ncbi:PREDICTED: homeobox protein 2-like isoform X2 [Populus euphratica]|uniref:Homeobox protein 2-like isoform X2 n=1 Tax=Populus euphratica TaxID=75702 RepID=A0AAJ6V9S1_POPEU|nr:PREDICTED: homeobox protein 2-like isoform X2 [Populus euphratica]